MNRIIYIIALMLIVACNSKKQEKKGDTKTKDSSVVKTDSSNREDIYTIAGDSVVIPPFEIEISLSPKASQKITSAKETIIVDVFLTGNPKDSSKVQLEEDGSYYVGSVKREITYGQLASFSYVKFPKKIYDQLADKDVQFDINVYSGRKSSGDNLLDVDFLSGKLSTLVNKRTKLNGKLIGE